MEDFQRRLTAIQAEALAEKPAEQWQAEMAGLMAAYHRHAAAEAFARAREEKVNLLTRLLFSLQVPEMLGAMHDLEMMRGYKGPVTVPNTDRLWARIVLRRVEKRLLSFSPAREHQIGVRAYDAGAVYIEVADYRREGSAWHVTPVRMPAAYYPERHQAMQEFIAGCLLAWAKARIHYA